MLIAYRASICECYLLLQVLSPTKQAPLNVLFVSLDVISPHWERLNGTQFFPDARIHLTHYLCMYYSISHPSCQQCPFFLHASLISMRMLNLQP